jgi:hypothetical protein
MNNTGFKRRSGEAETEKPRPDNPETSMAAKRRRILLVALIAIAVSGIAWLTVARDSAAFSPPGELVSEKHFGDYQVNIYHQNQETLFERLCDKLPSRLASLAKRIHGNSPPSGFEILKHGRRLYSQYGGNFSIAELEGGSEVVGRDITGDGTPKIALTDELGRQRGGSLFIFECAGQVRLIAVVESLGTFPKLKDLDGDGIPEVIASDDEFYHWPVCRDGEPMPEVILRWRDGKYVAAKDLMFKPAPTSNELSAKAAQIRASPEWESNSAPEALWTNAVALMYGGHEALGWDFVEAAWKPGFPDKEDLINYYLRGKLEDSIYWQELKTSILTSSSSHVLER